MSKAINTVAARKPQLTRVTSDKQLLQAVNNLTATVQLFAGQNQDKLERAVTFKDLQRSGFSVGGLTADGGEVYPPPPPDTDPDLTVPPAMSDVHFEVTLDSVLAFWNPAGYKRHAYVEVWLAAGTKKIGGLDQPTVLSDAHFYGTCPTTAIAIAVPAGDSIRVWLRNVGQNTLAGPWHDEGGTSVKVPDNPSYLLDKISGEIRETHLFKELGDKISDSAQKVIEHGTSLLDIKSELLVHSASLAKDYQTLAAHTSAISAQGNSISTLQSVVTGHGSTIATHETSLNNQASSISSIMQVNTTQNSSIASHATLLNSHGNSITNLSQLTTTHGNTLATHSTSISSLNSSVITLAQVNTTQDTTIASHATMLESHGNSITNLAQVTSDHTGTLATYGTSISSLNSSVVTLAQVNTTQNTTLASHTTTLTSYGNSISSLSSITTDHGNLLSASYTLRIDAGGSVHGFGLAVDGTTKRSDFVIRADRFAIAAPQAYDVNGKPIVQTAAFPFVVDVSNVNAPKVLIKNAYISAAYIETLVASKVSATYINALNLSAVNISGGQITIGNNFSVDVYGNMTCANGIFKGTAQSSNFVSGSAGWRILNTGTAELNQVTVRGTVYANDGWFKGTIYAEKLVGGAYTKKVYASDVVADFVGSVESTWRTAKRITVGRGMTASRVLEINGGYSHYVITSDYSLGSDAPPSFSADLRVGVRLVRDGSIVVDSYIVEHSAGAPLSYGARAIIEGNIGAIFSTLIPADGLAHYYELQFRAEPSGFIVTNGSVSASIVLGSDADDKTTVVMYIESGDLS